MTKGYIQKPIREPMGLKDENHTILVCSNCDVPLIDILTTNPEFDADMTFQAICCYCGDHSFETEVHGKIFVGSTEYALFERDEQVDGIVVLHTAKGKKEWQNSK